MILLGLPPVSANARTPGGSARNVTAARAGRFDPLYAVRPCPTRFDYLLLASFADAPSALSLSAYHFRAAASSQNDSPPVTGLLRTGYAIGPEDCRPRTAILQIG